MTTKQAVAAGLIPPPPGSDEAVVRRYPDALVQAVIDDLGGRNLRDLRDHETRWLADRCKAARGERRRRKAAGKWNPERRVA